MKNKVLLLCAFLIFSTILMSISGCADKTEKNETDTMTTGKNEESNASAAETTEEKILPDLPENDFGEYKFKIAHFEMIDWDSGGKAIDIFSEGETGDTINDMVYRRNSAVENKYNFKIELQVITYNQIVDAVRKSVRADDDAYDLAYVRLYEVPSLMTDGSLLDLHKLKFLDFSKPWWDKNSVENLSLDHKLFLTASDFNIIDKNATYCMLFNKNIHKELGLPDFYQAVKDGKWTMDMVYSAFRGISKDLDGDGELKKGDFFGFLGRHDVTAAFFRGAGSKIAEKNSEDMPELKFFNEHNVNVIDKIFDIILSPDFTNLHMTGSKGNEYDRLFADEKGLFNLNTVGIVEYLRGEEVDFGILPIPKYDEAQERYYNLISVHGTGLISVPASAKNLDRTGIILEALSAESMYTLQPAYKEKALKGKYVRDNESEEMLDIIFRDRIYDIGDICNFEDFSYQFLLIAEKKTRDITSFYEKYEPKLLKAFENFNKKILEIE